MTELNPALRAAARQSFRQLTAQRDAITAVATPLREARDAFVREESLRLEAARSVMDAEILAAEDGLFALNQEIANLARFLGGKTGEVGTEADLETARGA